MKNAESSPKTGSTKKTPASPKKAATTGADKDAAKKRFGIKAKAPAPAPRQPRTRQRLSVTVLGNAGAETPIFEDPILAELTAQIETPARFGTRTPGTTPSHEPDVAIDLTWPTPAADAIVEEAAPVVPETVTFVESDEDSLWPAAIWPSIEDVVATATEPDPVPAAKKDAQPAARGTRTDATAPKARKPATGPASRTPKTTDAPPTVAKANPRPASSTPLLELPDELGITTHPVTDAAPPLDIPLDLAPTPPDVARDSVRNIPADHGQTADIVPSSALEIPVDRNAAPPTGAATPLDLPLDVDTEVPAPSTQPPALTIDVDLSPVPPVGDATVPQRPTATTDAASEPKTKAGSRGSRKEFADRIAALVEVVEQASATEALNAEQPGPVAPETTVAPAGAGRRRNRTTISADAAAASTAAADTQVAEKHAADARAADEQADADRRAAETLAAAQRAEDERAAEQAAEKLAAEKRAAEKLAAEKRASEKRAAEKLAAEKRAEEQAAKKLAAEKLAAEKRAAEKLAAEKRAAEKLAAEKLAAEKLAAEKVAADKRAEEQAARKLAAERAAEQRAAAKRAAAREAAEKLAAEERAAKKRAAEKEAAEKLAAEQLAAEKEAAEKRAAEKRAAEKRAAQKRAAEKLAAEQRAADERAAEKEAAEKRAADERAAEKRRAEASQRPAPKRASTRKAAQPPAASHAPATPESQKANTSGGMSSWLTAEEAALEAAASSVPATDEARHDHTGTPDEALAGWPAMGEFASGTAGNNTAEAPADAPASGGFQPYRAVYERHLHTGNLAPEVINNLPDLSVMPNKPRFFSAEVAAAEEEARARHRMESVKEGDGSPIVFEIPAEGGRTVRIVVSSDDGVEPVVSAGVVEQPTSAEQERLEARLAAIEEELRRVESRTNGEDGDLRNARQREIADAVHNALGDRELAPHFDFTMGNGRFTFQRRTPAEATPER